jgi:hypothetical protein
MVDMRKRLHRQAVAAHSNWHAIPQASVVERMSVVQAPLATFATQHPANLAFASLWADVECRLLDLEAAAKQRAS